MGNCDVINVFADLANRLRLMVSKQMQFCFCYVCLLLLDGHGF